MIGTTLYAKSKSGKILVWKADTDYQITDKGIKVVVTHGYQDGAIKTKDRFTVSGKNIGKANETTIQEQTVKDIESLYNYQLTKRGYFKDPSEIVEIKTAMLAHVYENKAHLMKVDDQNNYINTYYIQPKLNGIRCTIIKVSETSLTFLSRRNQIFTPFPHIEKDLLSQMNVGDMVDGELFTTIMPFENILSIVRSQTDRYILHPATKTRLFSETDIQFHMYDCVPNGKADMPFTERLAHLKSYNFTSNVIQVPTKPVKNLNEIKTQFTKWVDEGYEGLMIREGSSVYTYRSQSTGLLKYKEMFDEEFKILDILESEQDPGQPRFVVEITKDITCDVRMSGSKSVNTEFLLNKKKYIGSYLTVQYQTRTDSGNLSFPVGLYIRDGVVEDSVFKPTI